MRVFLLGINMRISPVNSIVKQTPNQQKSKNQSFSGLWGKTSSMTDFDPGLSVPVTTTTYYYYPFRDEKPSEVDKVIKSKSSAQIVDYRRYVINDCKQCMMLPFSEQDYKDYSEISSASDIKPITKIVHRNVRDKYTNSVLYKQDSAANPIIGPTIDALLYLLY